MSRAHAPRYSFRTASTAIVSLQALRAQVERSKHTADLEHDMKVSPAETFRSDTNDNPSL